MKVMKGIMCILISLMVLSILNVQVQASSPFCASSANNQTYEWIVRVKIHDGTQNSGKSGYTDYTGSPLATLTAGTTYNVEVDVATNNTTWHEYVKIWFDMNQNDAIEDPEELVFNMDKDVNPLETFSGTITVPSTAFNGHIYVRIIMQYAANPSLCGTYTYGETEDYLVNVIGATTNPENKTLTVATAGSGTGGVTSSPSGINTSVGVNSFDFAENEVVTLTATPTGGSSFTNWTGDCSGTNTSVAVTMSANKNCTANLAEPLTSEMSVEGTSIEIADNDASPSTADGTDFGATLIAGGTVDHTFTIKNTGTANLNLTGTPKVQVSGTNAADFTVTAQPTTPVTSGGGTTTFTVRFDPSAIGTHSATISIANNDADENPYNFTIQGTGSGAPEMVVWGNSHTITSGDTTPSTTDDTDFGSTDIVTGTVDHTFTIDSTGTTPLTLTGSPKVAISGGNAADFTVTAQPSSSVAPSTSTNFTIRFDPSDAGVRTATVSIGNNSTENPYTFAIQGTGVVSSGDVNNDGVINVLDVRLCMQIAVGCQEGVIPGTAAQHQQADMNGDGQVTLVDAQLLADYIIGISH